MSEHSFILAVFTLYLGSVEVRSILTNAEIAQLVEHVHGKDGVAGSIPALGSTIQLEWVVVVPP